VTLRHYVDEKYQKGTARKIGGKSGERGLES
jgi:hypothetical protein